VQESSGLFEDLRILIQQPDHLQKYRKKVQKQEIAWHLSWHITKSLRITKVLPTKELAA
jgi:hypothetical protein